MRFRVITTAPLSPVIGLVAIVWFYLDVLISLGCRWTNLYLLMHAITDQPDDAPGLGAIALTAHQSLSLLQASG